MLPETAVMGASCGGIMTHSFPSAQAAELAGDGMQAVRLGSKRQRTAKPTCQATAVKRWTIAQNQAVSCSLVSVQGGQGWAQAPVSGL